jgi:hypothetical protein
MIFPERFFRRLALRLTRMTWLFQTPLMWSSGLRTMRLCPLLILNMGVSSFVDGPGGTGKTYLYKVLLATIRSQKKIVVATASSGVAASIMPGGRTAHSRFKIPLSIDGR